MSSEISLKADISPKARIGDGCEIFPFVHIENDAIIGDNYIILLFASILNGTRMGNDNKIHQDSVLAALPQDFEFIGEKNELIIGNSNIIQENTVISRAAYRGYKTVLGSNDFLMEGVRVSHDTAVGDHCTLGYGARVAGDCNIGADALISSNVVEKANTRVGECAVVQAGTTFSKGALLYTIASGSPIGYHGINTTISKTTGVDDKVLKHIVNAYRLSFHGQTSVFDVCIQIERQVPDSPEIHNIPGLIRGTEEGIINKL